jgi:hypothetical protein
MVMTAQYVIPPPSFPPYLCKMSLAPFIELARWAYREHKARLKYYAENGFFKEYVVQNEQYSPIRMLAELPGFRRYCSHLGSNRQWPTADPRFQDFIIKSYNLRELVFSKNGI